VRLIDWRLALLLFVFIICGANLKVSSQNLKEKLGNLIQVENFKGKFFPLAL
jgi:hypothetical protein